MPLSKNHFDKLTFTTRIPALDGIRALAVLMVFFNHFGGGSHGGVLLQTLNVVRGRMQVGVDLFFCLSGFLITGILFDTVHDSHFWSRFYIRRSLRILPVFFLLALVLALLTPFLHYQWRWPQALFLVYLGNIPANHDFSLYSIASVTYKPATAMIGHLWTLCVEEQFYVLWPIAVWLIRDRVRLLRLTYSLCALALILRVIAVVTLNSVIAERWIVRTLPFRMDGLLMGAAIALLLRGPNGSRVLRKAGMLFLLSLVPLGAILIWSPAYDSPWYLTIGLSSTAMAAAGLIGLTIQNTSQCNRFFNLRPLRFLGKYSYGFYVWHVVWQGLWIQLLILLETRLQSLALAGLIEISLAFFVTMMVAIISYRYVERPFLRMKRHFEYDSESRSGVTAFAPDGR